MALGVASTTDPVTAAVSRLLGALRDQQRWLLIFDNAEDPAALAAYLPGGGGHVVITSRDPGWQELATPVAVDVFDRNESIALLRRRAWQLTTDDAGQIAEALGDLPLALTQAGAYLADTATPVPEYLALLAERTTELLAQDAPATYPVSLAASVQIALNRLTAQSPAALQLLTLAAYLAPEPIPLTLVTTDPTPLPNPLATAAADPLAFTALTRLLRQHGLAHVESTTLTLHRLLAAILRDHTNQDSDLFTLVVQLLRNAVPDGNPWNNPPVWAAWRQLLPHILVATDPHRTLPELEERVAWLLDRTGWYLLIRGEPKSEAGKRSVAIPDVVLADLRDHLGQLSEVGQDGLVFVGPKGGRLRRRNFHRLLTKALTDAKVVDEDVHFHDLRHTGNALAAATGASTKELMARMGHSSIRAALIYQHASRSRDKQIADGISQNVQRTRRKGHARGTTKEGTG
jgi:Phage integrase family